jgi:hypothetical protein
MLGNVPENNEETSDVERCAKALLLPTSFVRCHGQASVLAKRESSVSPCKLEDI